MQHTKTKIRDYSNGKMKTEEALKIISELSEFFNKHEERNRNTSHINYKIYPLLCRPYTHVSAYSKIINNKGATTRGVDDPGILEYFGKINAKQIADKIKNKLYK